MKSLFLALLFPVGTLLSAAPVTLTVEAPTYPSQEVTLYRYLDAFTLRKLPIADGFTNSNGHVELTAEVRGTQRVLLRIGEVGADFFLRPGHYHLRMPAPGPKEAVPISGTARVDPEFIDLDPLDVNALVSDLNERLDGFVAQDLATDQDAGMEAVAKAREGSAKLVPDTARKRPDLFISPRWSEARVDTFAKKLQKFYAGVKDPWFQSNVEYGIAGLRLGPRSSDRDHFERYLKGRPVLYDVPEYTRFFTSFFTDHLMRFPFRTDTDALIDDIAAARTDSLKALLAKNEFLKDDRLNELVLITQLYAQQANQQFDHVGILKVLADVRDHSHYPEHRLTAADMLWDLTTMRPGTQLPPVPVRDTTGFPRNLDDLLHGPVCLLVTTTGGTYGEKELAAYEKLYNEYKGYVTFISVDLEARPTQLKTWMDAHPKRDWHWFVPGDRQRFLDQLRLRSVPSLIMLQDRRITASPGPLPSQGLAAALFTIKAKADEAERLKHGRGAPPPRH
jgi:hypothetical protein